MHLWTTKPGGRPTSRKRPADPDGHPTQRPRRLTRSRETPGRETHRGRSEEGGATTGGRGDTPPSKAPEPRDPDDPKNDGGTAGETASAVCLQEPGEPAKNTCPAARATSSREARRRIEIRRQLTAAWRCAPATEKP